MYSTGLTRKVDQMGRIVIPSEIRALKNIDEGSMVEFYMDKDFVGIKRNVVRCIFCDSMENLTTYKGKPVCQRCRDGLNG